MNSDPKKIIVAEINDQWTNGAKDTVMDYANN